MTQCYLTGTVYLILLFVTLYVLLTGIDTTLNCTADMLYSVKNNNCSRLVVVVVVTVHAVLVLVSNKTRNNHFLIAFGLAPFCHHMLQ